MAALQGSSSLTSLYRRVSRVIPPFEWPLFEADIEAILRLKVERNAIILAHNYQSPEIFHCVADVVGDSLALAREAAKGDARVIVMAGVHFMAETAKLLNPSKTVLIPDEYLARNVAAQTKVEIVAWRGRCEVHEQFTAADIRELREAHPDAIVLAHPECSPEVVAAADFCRLDRRHDQVCRDQTAGAGRTRHRMLDERQRRNPIS